MKAYVFDTSALFAYIEDEDGANEVESLLRKSLEGEVQLFMSVVGCIEIFYVTWQEQGRKIANSRLKLIRDLMVTMVSVDEEMIKIVGEIKAKQSMSFADCCIAGLAKSKKATLVHKDPEYESLGSSIRQFKLPYKQNG